MYLIKSIIQIFEYQSNELTIKMFYFKWMEVFSWEIFHTFEVVY